MHVSVHCLACVHMHVCLRFGCSLCDDTHTAAFDTAGGSEEQEREKGGDTGVGKNNTGGGGVIFCVSMHYACLMCTLVCACVNSFPREKVLFQTEHSKTCVFMHMAPLHHTACMLFSAHRQTHKYTIHVPYFVRGYVTRVFVASVFGHCVCIFLGIVFNSDLQTRLTYTPT